MRLVIHSSVLDNLFGANSDWLMKFDGCKLGINTEIINEYANSQASKSQLYQTWFATYQANNKFEIIPNSFKVTYHPVSSTNLYDYIYVSYFHGHNLIIDDSYQISLAEQQELEAFGITHTKLSNYAVYKNASNFGIKPFVSHFLNKQKQHGPELISSYFKNEKSIFIYDKYINDNSLEVILNCCANADNNASINILTSNYAPKQPHIIEQELRNIKPHATITCSIAHRSTLKEMHDRYIVLGDRIQFTFTSGIDVFGPKVNGNYVNRRGDISLYFLLHQNYVTFRTVHNNQINVRFVD